MTTQDFCRLAEEQYNYVEYLHQFVEAVRRMREVQKDMFAPDYSTRKWKVEHHVDALLKNL